ncbi:MAG: hypothetical protein KAS32_14010 [Candidatus Peribacteraceae bacterium]|nr:hypothetical protein [Candidatus Peribacteraceae bacterium]
MNGGEKTISKGILKKNSPTRQTRPLFFFTHEFGAKTQEKTSSSLAPPSSGLGMKVVAHLKRSSRRFVISKPQCKFATQSSKDVVSFVVDVRLSSLAFRLLFPLSARPSQSSSIFAKQLQRSRPCFRRSALKLLFAVLARHLAGLATKASAQPPLCASARPFKLKSELLPIQASCVRTVQFLPMLLDNTSAISQNHQLVAGCFDLLKRTP